MAKSYFYDESIADWRELVKGEQGEQGPVGPVGPEGPQGEQGPMGSVELVGDPSITVDTSVGTRVFVGDTMIYGDTGWVDIRPIMKNGWTAGLRVRMRRVNDTVTFQAQGGNSSLDGSEATSSRVFEFPDGFSPSVGTYGGLGVLAAGGGNRLTASASEGDIRIPTGHQVDGELFWDTSEDWPTSLVLEPIGVQ